MNNQAQLPARAPAFVDFDTVMPSMQALVLDYLAARTEVTFIELEDDVPGFSGELEFVSSSDRKTVLWQGVSGSGVHALHELERQGLIEFKRTSFRTYQHKGRRLYLPVDEWKSNMRHWAPVLVRLKVLKVETH